MADDLCVPDGVDRAGVVETDLPIGNRSRRVVGECQLALDASSPVVDISVAHRKGNAGFELIERGKRCMTALRPTVSRSRLPTVSI